MRIRKTALVLAAMVATVGALLVAQPAQAATTRVFYETVGPNDVSFIPACIPGPSNPTCDPRGPGSLFISWGPLSLTQGGAQVGTITTNCLTTFKWGNDYMGQCTDTLYLPGETIVATGQINESALERYEAQTLNVPRGTLTVLQVVYPNVFKLTLTIN